MDSFRLIRSGSPAAGGPWIPSLVLLGALALFCGATRWGRTYPTFLRKTWTLWSTGHGLTAEERRRQGYDETYPILRYIRENTPPDAVVLMPPVKMLAPKPGVIPLLASPSSAYDFIYPRVPVHWGDASPWKDRINYILVWNHWGLNLVEPGAPETEENRIQLYPWPPERKVSW